MLNLLFDRWWKRVLLFALIVGFVYLPSAFQLTYYRDDWYYAYDALVGPAGIFRALFSSDRPARGPFYEIYYALFGMNPIAYHIGMYFWRATGGLAVTWLFAMLWPRQRQAGFLAGLLFALYPGFTWWVSGIEYQPMVASAALMVLSLALTIHALYTTKPIVRIISILGSIATGWIYLSLVEYAAGMEVLRFILVYLWVARGASALFWRKLNLALRKWAISSIIPFGFIIWRFVFFNSERKATDLGAQLGIFLVDPVKTSLHWLINFLVSLINVTLAAWISPLMSNFFSGNLREILNGFLFAFLAVVLGWLALYLTEAGKSREEDAGDANWQMDVIGVGSAGLVLGILPVILANRQISFPNFSHYALPASFGVVFLAGGLTCLIENKNVKSFVWMVLLALSALTHQGLGASAVREEQVIAGFWQQMVWRAPSLAQGTTLMVYYPDFDYGEDTDIVWGPANYIYYSKLQGQIPVNAPIAALTTGDQDVYKVLLGHDDQESPYRTHTMTLNYDNMLVISQPSVQSCVHVVDARWPEFSVSDKPALLSLASFSRIDNVDTASNPVKLPAFLFGRELEQRWCFYYQKAELARQQGDWEEVARIGYEVEKLGYHPNDQIEWMPFLQAYALLGDQKELKDISTRINTEKFYKKQACEILRTMPRYGYTLQPGMIGFVNELFCGGK